ncbi:MAG: OmpA family protein [Thermosynechococcaceae cyanobacterium]
MSIFYSVPTMSKMVARQVLKVPQNGGFRGQVQGLWLDIQRQEIPTFFSLTPFKLSLSLCTALFTVLSSTALPGLAQESTQKLTVVVNSNQDGEIQPDESLTLREAIALTNGTLSRNQLSAAEQAQVSDGPSHIEFDLPSGATTIKLQTMLPPITSAVVIDGTTQAGSGSGPIVALTAAENSEVLRGLTLAADNVTIRGLSLYGFTATHNRTATTPPADIFVVHQLLPQSHQQAVATQAENFTLKDNHKQSQPPKGILIENNWLGITPEDQMPARLSAFGVSVFNSTGTTIRHNRIAHHDGSAIITGSKAENLIVNDNQIVGNGLAGMPDAIRLEGKINNGVIRNNLICGNDGSAIYLFKPDGAVDIHGNTIKFNGQRLRRSAIYLMGSDHKIHNNEIRYQTGPGVTVAAYPRSDRNIITQNRFNHLDGLSIDLVTRNNVGVSAYQRGDGANVPQRDTGNRRLDTGNRAINTPEFLSREFLIFNGQVGIDGVANPGATVTLYRVVGTGVQGPLSEPLIDVVADQTGRFSATLTDLQPGDRISAIATLTDTGTSEPALNAVIRTAAAAAPEPDEIAVESPNCGEFKPKAMSVSIQPPAIIPVQIRAEAPQKVHFGLNQDTLSPASQVALDQVARVLKKYPTVVIDLHGHTDSRATAAYNQDLAQRRAMQVRRYLLGQGVDPARITIRSWGETQLLTGEGDRTALARNRRVEFVYRDLRGIDLVIVDQTQDLQVEP